MQDKNYGTECQKKKKFYMLKNINIFHSKETYANVSFQTLPVWAHAHIV